jgi:hypothetical protein
LDFVRVLPLFAGGRFVDFKVQRGMQGRNSVEKKRRKKKNSGSL